MSDLGPATWTADHGLVVLGVILLVAIATIVFLYRRQLQAQREHMEELREREQRTRLALWASGEMYWRYHLGSRELERIRVERDRGAELSVRSAVARVEDIHPDDLPHLQDRLREYVRGQAPVFVSEHRMRERDGWVWVRARGRAIAWGDDGRITQIAGTARDITAIREKERERSIAGEVMRNMAEAVVVIDADFRFVAVNPAFTTISGYEEADVIGRDASLLDSGQHDPAFYAEMRRAILANPRWTGELWQRRKDGRDFLSEVRTNGIVEPGTGHPLYVIVESDITERRRIEQELRYLANYDTLTNLPNRTLMTERLSRAIVRARRQGTHLAVLFLDLDQFKDVNDTLGHATGDRILRAAAQRLQEVVATGQTVARIGGDEFTVLLEGIDGPEAAEACARAIIHAFDQPLRVDDRRELTITPSIGISLFPDHAQVPTDLLKQADTAMYQAKAAGRRTFLTYAETMDVDLHLRASLLASLRRVIQRGELEVVYQPQMALGDGRIVGVEALLRWRSPEHGDVPPSQFIPLAEESGLIVPIGEWILRESCRTLAAWRAAGVDDDLVMSVNVSAVQLSRSDLPATVRSALQSNALPTPMLNLELTESVLMANAGHATARLDMFKAMGVAIAIDDFGTGYSSLSYLRRLPVSTLKIDKVFIDGLALDGDTEDNAIATTVIAMAHSLGMQVVAEGVETAEQLEVLQRHRCDRIQGYWLSPPLPADACLAFLRQHAAAHAASY